MRRGERDHSLAEEEKALRGSILTVQAEARQLREDFQAQVQASGGQLTDAQKEYVFSSIAEFYK